MTSLEDPVVVGKDPEVGVVATSQEHGKEQSKRKAYKNRPYGSGFLILDGLKKRGDKEDIAYVEIEPDPGNLGHKRTEGI